MSKPLSNTTNTPPAPAGSWQGSDARMAVPNTSMLLGSDQAPPAADAMLARVAQGAHDTIDRLADSVAPRGSCSLAVPGA